MTNNISTVVRQSIEGLLLEHAAHPFGVLREAGVQADLRQRLLNHELLGHRLDVLIHEKAPGRLVWPPKVLANQLLRVQLEMKLEKTGSDSSCTAQDQKDSRADVIVLKDQTINLICYPNGPGDIVAAIDPQQVAVAIEIKASPSRTKEQRTKYHKDIHRLLALARQGVEAHFLLLDKSIEMYGNYAPNSRVKPGHVDWNNAPAVKSWLGLTVSKSTPGSTHCVAIWHLAASPITGVYVPTVVFAH